MKIRLIHMGDIHIKENELNQGVNPQKLINAISSLDNADAYSIVVSGDIASTGKEKEYSNAKNLFLKFIYNKSLKRKRQRLDFLYAPGNHDIDFSFPNMPKDYDSLRELFPDSQYTTTANKNKVILSTYGKSMNEFFAFAKNGHCEWGSPYVNVRCIDYEEYKIGFVLVNSAPFSLLGGQSVDKGFHYLPEDVLSTIERATDADINILVMHHSLEWFTDDCKRKLRDILSKKYFAVLLGHEHDETAENRVINNGGACLYCQTNALNDPTVRDNGFCVIDIDTQLLKYSVFSFVYKDDIYIHSAVSSGPIRKNNHSGVRIREDYWHLLQYNDKDMPYESCYFFPGIQYESFSEKKNINRYSITDEKEFADLLLNRDITRIIGGKKSGKTLLSKRLYCDYYEQGKVPLLFDTSINQSRKDRILEHTFNNQYYVETNAFERFMQLPVEKRVAIIDDADKIKPSSLDELLSILREKFGTIIVISQEDINTNIQQQVISAIDKEERFSIDSFWYRSRKGFVEKILRTSNISDDSIDQQATKINELINTQIKYFDLTPDYIIDFVNQYLQDTRFQLSSGREAFSLVYETSLKNRILHNSQVVSAEKVMNVLQEVAYYMHFLKKKAISINELIECIQRYESDYRQKISFTGFIEVCKKASILKEANNTYIFQDSTQLAYFVARAINQKASLDSNDPEYMDAEEKFLYVLNNLCFGINCDIVLYLSVITSSTRFVNMIIDQAISHFSEMEEYSIDKENLSFVSDTNIQIGKKAPTNDDRQHRDSIISDRERELKESDVFELMDEYDYDESEAETFINQSLKSLKYIEVLSKVLPAFCANMKRSQQDKLVDLIYRAPNKFIYMQLKDISGNFDEFAERLKDAVNKKGNEITSADIKEFTKIVSTMLIISLYHLVAKTASSIEAIQALNDFPELEKNTNYDLMHLMIKARLYDLEGFSRDAIAMDKKQKLPIAHTCINFTVWDYLLRNKIPLHGTGEALIQHFYGNKMKKEIQISQAKHYAKE